MRGFVDNFTKICKELLLLLSRFNCGRFFIYFLVENNIVCLYKVIEILVVNRRFYESNEICFRCGFAAISDGVCLKDEKDLISAVNKISKGSKFDSFHSYYKMFRLFTRVGRFKAAWLCRIKNQLIIINKKGHNSFEAKQIAFEIASLGEHEFRDALIELGVDDFDFNLLSPLISEFSKDLNSGLNHLKNSSLALRKYEIDKHIRSMSEYEKRQLEKIIDKRNIYLIGPSVYDSVNFDANINFDYVARIGYTGPASISYGDEINTNLSFYKEAKLKDMLKLGCIAVIKKLDFVYVGGNSSPALLEEVGKIKDFILSDFSGPILSGSSPNAGLELVLCLVDMGVNCVYISNIDMFVGEHYPAGYVYDNSDGYTVRGGSLVSVISKKKMCNSFVNHFPLPQFAIYKWLREKEVVVCDEVLDKVLDEGAIGYLEKLNSNYCL